MTSKTCKRCNTPKPLSDYDKHGRCKGGYVHTCKDCLRPPELKLGRRQATMEWRVCPECDKRFEIRKSTKQRCCSKICGYNHVQQAKPTREWKALGKRRTPGFFKNCMPIDQKKEPCAKYDECGGKNRKKSCRVEPSNTWAGSGINRAIDIEGRV